VFLDRALDTTPLVTINKKVMITNSWVEFTLLRAQWMTIKSSFSLEVLSKVNFRKIGQSYPKATFLGYQHFPEMV
jgi:hypothetical protein